MTRISIPTEHQEQSTYFEMLSRQTNRYPQLALIHAVPNGAYKSRSAAAKFKREGLKSGVPDICIPIPNGKFGACYIEMKRKGAKPSENQLWWHEQLKKYGNQVYVCYSWIEAWEATCDYLELK